MGDGACRVSMRAPASAARRASGRAPWLKPVPVQCVRAAARKKEQPFPSPVPADGGLHARLREILAEIPRNGNHILTSALGRPRKEFGFSTAWQRTVGHKELAVIREVGLVFHGFGKRAAVKLAEAGCTDAEIERNFLAMPAR
jgi:hypothetical protein